MRWPTAPRRCSRAFAKATGGWRFGSYDPSGNPIPFDPSSCFGCHAQAKETDLVFTSFNP
jgi:hypothetical protein